MPFPFENEEPVVEIFSNERGNRLPYSDARIQTSSLKDGKTLIQWFNAPVYMKAKFPSTGNQIFEPTKLVILVDGEVFTTVRRSINDFAIVELTPGAHTVELRLGYVESGSGEEMYHLWSKPFVTAEAEGTVPNMVQSVTMTVTDEAKFKVHWTNTEAEEDEYKVEVKSSEGQVVAEKIISEVGAEHTVTLEGSLIEKGEYSAVVTVGEQEPVESLSPLLVAEPKFAYSYPVTGCKFFPHLLGNTGGTMHYMQLWLEPEVARTETSTYKHTLIRNDTKAPLWAWFDFPHPPSPDWNGATLGYAFPYGEYTLKSETPDGRVFNNTFTLSKETMQEARASVVPADDPLIYDLHTDESQMKARVTWAAVNRFKLNPNGIDWTVDEEEGLLTVGFNTEIDMRVFPDGYFGMGSQKLFGYMRPVTIRLYKDGTMIKEVFVSADNNFASVEAEDCVALFEYYWDYNGVNDTAWCQILFKGLGQPGSGDYWAEVFAQDKPEEILDSREVPSFEPGAGWTHHPGGGSRIFRINPDDTHEWVVPTP